MAEVTNSKLLNIDAGIPKKNACVVLVKTEWNAAIVDELEKGCREKL
jgi:6,7-dimethyl-8-ribityllumazine synthase